VPNIGPTKLELNLLEEELKQVAEPAKPALTVTLKTSLSDPDFDPRALTPNSEVPQDIVETSNDLFGLEDNFEHKVLTPAKDVFQAQKADDFDPFDTSIASNIQPGKAELKLLESELIPEQKVVTTIADILLDNQESAIFANVLTPQPLALDSFDIEESDPFDTSFASNLVPGQAEIKLLESELIHK
jgi:hypothetical protein